MQTKNEKKKNEKKGIEQKHEIRLPEPPETKADELHIFHGKTVQPGWFVDF